MSSLILITCLFSVILICAFIDYNNLKRMRNDHIRFAELGAEIIGKYDLSERQETFIRSCLSDVSQWWFMPFAVTMIPVILFKLVLHKPIELPSELMELRKYEEFKEFRSLHISTLTSSNSFFTIVFMMLITICLLPLLILRGLKDSIRVGEATLYRTSPRFSDNDEICA